MKLVKTGDVVVNYKHSTICVYNDNNTEHAKELFSCRFATFAEIQKFKQSSKESIKLHDIQVNRREVFKKIKVQIEFDKYEINRIHRFCRENNIENYKEFIFSLLREDYEQKTGIEKNTENKEKKELEIIKEAFKSLMNLIK